jgi:hypothetical protein
MERTLLAKSADDALEALGAELGSRAHVLPCNP